MTIVNLEGTGHPTVHTRRMIADSWNVEGAGFMAAADLLRQQDGHHEGFASVTLHLLGQGIEVTLKSLLLLRDYKTFKPRLGRGDLGHDLEKLAGVVRTSYGLDPLEPALAAELAQLNEPYSKHELRYAGLYTFFIDPRGIPCELVFRWGLDLLKLYKQQRQP